MNKFPVGPSACVVLHGKGQRDRFTAATKALRLRALSFLVRFRRKEIFFFSQEFPRKVETFI